MGDTSPKDKAKMQKNKDKTKADAAKKAQASKDAKQAPKPAGKK